ncbi:MAG: YqiA/YcfP family alpha/beta fold hydrolase [Moraxella sp.]|nr:YqiA/YcfP family alpha/beta fold hydrolase [Moraxella sp.]
MTIIYLHGLDSSPNASKAVITKRHADTLGTPVFCPDLNCPPDDVLSKVLALINTNDDVVLIGSSLGGYFANLISDLTGTPAVLLNPSIRPDVSFRRFLSDNFADKPLAKETVIYTTTGGWQIRFGDLAWFETRPLTVQNPAKIRVLLKMGDELLNAHAACQFYQDKGAFVLAQDGGDHQMSDYDKQVNIIFNWIDKLKSPNH